MASVNVASAAVAVGGNLGRGNIIGVDKLPEEMNEMKIRDDKVEPGIAKVVKQFNRKRKIIKNCFNTLGNYLFDSFNHTFIMAIIVAGHGTFCS